MAKVNRLKSATALLLTAGMSVTTIAQMLIPSAAIAQSSRFADVSNNYWAADYINALVSRGVIAGFPDGTFKPDAPVTRAQFSSMVQGAFNKAAIRNSVNFIDVPSNHWARRSIDDSYRTGFLSGYPGNIFRPEQNIPREQVLVSLANGFDYSATQSVNQVLSYYSDQANISNYARSSIAAATENSMVVNYPVLKNLNPQRNATRAEVAAFIYQALVAQNQASPIASSYIVPSTTVATEFRIPAGTTIPVRYEQEKILLMDDETLPVTLTVATNITTTDGKLLIPRDSKVVGELRPANGGTQFVAQQLVFPNGDRKAFSATSETITTTETIRTNSSVTNLLKNAAIGSAAAAAISAVTGDRTVTAGEVLIGTGSGALASLIQRFLGLNSVDVLVVNPDTDLNLTLDSDVIVSVR
ncbi:MAG: S-layer homology domain-containing protein [Jaaginema sp. PMC 1079.18]|nr:S-layer homology domain-containing protein [Jaaginema sp. PMC 1080.18]MEC4851404.1 S-layer homology domain-containing protein [Jaaginema sp. PMC 1079.18]MEC4868219.1 S-layer homology domain-containing protein [Jaaginema sp. PMC 1078.18]